MPRGVKGSGAMPPKAAVKAVSVVPARAPVATPADQRPLASVCVDELSGQALRDYATRAGLSKRDVESLTEDRLRQNVKLFIVHHIELLTEG